MILIYFVILRFELDTLTGGDKEDSMNYNPGQDNIKQESKEMDENEISESSIGLWRRQEKIRGVKNKIT